MPTTCTEITCPEECAAALPEALFSICAPDTNFGQIAKTYMGNDGYPLTDENSLVEWQTRANLPANDPSRILELSVMGDKPIPTTNEVELSRGRTVTGAKEHILNFKVDETNQTNYELMRNFECGRTVRVWYETLGGLLYGGTEGVLASIILGEVIPESTGDLITYQGTAKWKAKFSPCRTESPMAGMDLVEDPGS